MGVLSDRAKAGVARVNNRPDLPGWWGAMQIAGISVVLIFVAIDVMSGKSAISSNSNNLPSGYVTIDNANKGLGGSNGNTKPTGSTDSVQVPLSSNPSGSATVPTSSLAMAKIAASAIFTGDRSGLVVSSGRTFTPPVSPAASVNILSITLISQSPTKITFASSVDLSDGVGPRTFNLSVLLENNNWVFLPGA